MIASMTSFAQVSATEPWGTLSAELRSVNHRYLEMSIKLPESLREHEMAVRERIRQHLSRGKVDVFIKFQVGEQLPFKWQLNQPILSQLAALNKEVDAHVPVQASFTELLKWPGVLLAEDTHGDQLAQALFQLLQQLLDEAVSVRQREGERLAQDMQQRLARIAARVDEVELILPEQVELHRAQLKERVSKLQLEVDEVRFEQEMVWWLQKIDVAEEIARLKTHLVEIQRVLGKGHVIGRRLDFLMQEMNREANTLASKSCSPGVTLAAVDIKVWVEQIREQVQNIE